jgi:hypothetical protein
LREQLNSEQLRLIVVQKSAAGVVANFFFKKMIREGPNGSRKGLNEREQ